MLFLVILFQLTCTQSLQQQRLNRQQNPVPGPLIPVIHDLLVDRESIQRINQYDREMIQTWLDQLKLERLTIDQIKTLTTGKKSLLYRKGMAVNRYLKHHYRRRRRSTIRWKTYGFLGPFLESYRILCNREELDDRDLWRSFARQQCRFNEKLFKKDIKKQLLEIIGSGDRIILDKKNRLTPFLAKMILTLWIEDRLKGRKERLRFLNTLIHKSNYSEMLCGGVCNRYSRYPFSQNPDLIAPHMGYQLLNSFHSRDYTRWSGRILSTNHPSLSKGILIGAGMVPLTTAGIECSLWLQQGLQKNRLYHSPDRMKSTLMRHQLVDHFKRIELHAETRLQPGDIVQLPGHTFIFMGYETIDGITYPVTLEATGGPARSAGIFYRPFPYEFDQKVRCGYPNHKRINNRWIKPHWRERWYLFRLKK